jgi:hypothetical protein
MAGPPTTAAPKLGPITIELTAEEAKLIILVFDKVQLAGIGTMQTAVRTLGKLDAAIQRASAPPALGAAAGAGSEGAKSGAAKGRKRKADAAESTAATPDGAVPPKSL